MACIICGFLMDKIGRKWTLIVMTLPASIGWILLALAGFVPLTSPYWFYAGRLLTGIGAGTFSFLAPVYTMEVCQQDMRGALGSLTGLFLVSGVLYAMGIGALTSWPILTLLCLLSPGMYNMEKQF